MSGYRHEDKWEVWGFPDDPEWDGKTYEIGYVTDGGTGACVAQGLALEDATVIVDVIAHRSYLATLAETYKNAADVRGALLDEILRIAPDVYTEAKSSLLGPGKVRQ